MYRASPDRSRDRDADTASDLGITALGWFTLLDAVATLVMQLYFSVSEADPTHRGWIFNYCQGIAAIGAFSLALWGVIWLLCMAFAESVIQGVLCLFVPFYSLFFSLSRWNERRGAFGLTLAPVAMVLVLLIIGGAAPGVRKINEGLYGPLQATNEPAPGSQGAAPASNSNSKSSTSWFGGGGTKTVTADATSVRLAEDAIRANVSALRRVTDTLSRIRDISSAPPIWATCSSPPGWPKWSTIARRPSRSARTR